MKRHLFTLLTFLILATNLVAQKEKAEPQNWPWKGISILSDEGDITSEDIRFIKEGGANFVRISLRVRQNAERKKISGEASFYESLESVARILKASHEEGISTMINMSQFPFDPNKDYNHQEEEFWNNREELDAAKNHVIEALSYFRERGILPTAIQILAEPVVRNRWGTELPDVWPSFSKELVSIVRQFDQKIYIVISPNKWGFIEGFDSYKAFDDDRIIYNTDYYTPHRYTHQGIRKNPLGVNYPGYIRLRYWDDEDLRKSMKDLRDFQIKNNALVMVSEYSVARWANGRDAYLKDVLDLFDEFGWSHAYWCYKGASVWDLEKVADSEGSKKLKRVQNPSWDVIKKSWQRNGKN